jgi:hypothetical protein
VERVFDFRAWRTKKICTGTNIYERLKKYVIRPWRRFINFDDDRAVGLLSSHRLGNELFAQQVYRRLGPPIISGSVVSVVSRFLGRLEKVFVGELV